MEMVGDATSAVVFDTETTGLDPNADTVVQVAAVYVDVSERRITDWRMSYVNPGDVPVDPRARAAHHIPDHVLRNAPPREEALKTILAPDKTGDLFMAVAHFADYDSPFLPEIRAPWLCTWKMARRIWPFAPAFGNQVLRYWLELDPELPRSLAPHDALYDALVTAHILIAGLNTGRSLGKLQADTKRPVNLATHGPGRITFGKYGPNRKTGEPGMLWTDVPKGYLNWMMRDGIEDTDQRYTVERLLGVQ